MLDSVLDARDRFLAPNGIMAPSQTRLVISGITGDRVFKERVEFWKGVYCKSQVSSALMSGFDMTTMDSVYFNEVMVEYVDEKEIVTSEFVVRVGFCHLSLTSLTARMSTHESPRPNRSTSTPTSS